jgi:solute carrier family 13 (sodium-dependent dicarboxylate transporter), member 2/3/5
LKSGEHKSATPQDGSRGGALRHTFSKSSTGLILALGLFTTILLIPIDGLSPQAARLAAIMAATVVLWITEALPMPVTALLAASLCVLMQVGTAKEVFAPFADPLMFLFIGSFILARAIFLHGLDRRLAFTVLSFRFIGSSPPRILFAFGAVTAFISAWISNTATTAMMFAIGLSILGFLRQRGEDITIYATGMMLMTSFSASIGGLATPIGTPPNIIGLGFIKNLTGVEISFLKWSLIGAPIVIVLYLFLFYYLNRSCAKGLKELTGSSEMLKSERELLGPIRRGEWSTIIAFTITVTLWVFPGIIALAFGEKSGLYQQLTRTIPEGVAALLGASLLFILPGDEGYSRAITWEEAVKIDWGVVLLYGGGFALGVLSFQTGLASFIGYSLTGLLPTGNTLVLLAASTLLAMIVSETTSNTASANMVVPVVIAVAKSMGVDPLEPAIGATLGSSLGFMLPVSTPCNAIVYGSGQVPLRSMIRYGIILDLAGVVVIVLLVRTLLPLIVRT